MNNPILETLSLEADMVVKIVNVQYHLFPNTMHTVCCITLETGVTFIGDAVTSNPDTFSEEMGRNVAYESAFNSMIKGLKLGASFTSALRQELGQ